MYIVDLESNKPEECAICMSTLITNKPLFACPRCHTTACHLSCMLEWLQNQTRCPLCNQELEYTRIGGKRPPPEGSIPNHVDMTSVSGSTSTPSHSPTILTTDTNLNFQVASNGTMNSHTRNTTLIPIPIPTHTQRIIHRLAMTIGILFVALIGSGLGHLFIVSSLKDCKGSDHQSNISMSYIE